MAAQTLVSEKYATLDLGADFGETDKVNPADIQALAEVDGNVKALVVDKYSSTDNTSGGKIVYLKYTSSNNIVCEYYPGGSGNNNGDYNIGGTGHNAPTGGNVQAIITESAGGQAA